MIRSVLLGAKSLSLQHPPLASTSRIIYRNLNISNSNQTLAQRKSKPIITPTTPSFNDDYDSIEGGEGEDTSGIDYREFELNQESIKLAEESGFKFKSYEDYIDTFGHALDSGDTEYSRDNYGGESEAWDEISNEEKGLPKIKIKKERIKRSSPSPSIPLPPGSTKPKLKPLQMPPYTPSIETFTESASTQSPINPYRPSLHLSSPHPQPHEYPLRTRFDWRLSSPLLKSPGSVYQEGTSIKPISLKKSWELPWKKIGINKLIGVGLDPARENRRRGSKRGVVNGMSEVWAGKEPVKKLEKVEWESADEYIKKQTRLLDLTVLAEELTYLTELNKQGTPLERFGKNKTILRAEGTWQHSASVVDRSDLAESEDIDDGGEATKKTSTTSSGYNVSIWKCLDGTVITQEEFPDYSPQTCIRFTPLNKSSTKPKERLTLENIGQKFHQGQLLEIKDGNLLVLFDPEAMFQIDGEYRIDIGRDESAIRIQKAALFNLFYDPYHQRVENLTTVEEAQVLFNKNGNDPEMKQLILKGTDLRELLIPDLQEEPEYYSSPVIADSSSDTSSFWDDPNVDFDDLSSSPSPSTSPAISTTTETIPEISIDRTISQNPSSIFSDNQLINSWIQRYRKEDPLVLTGDPDLGLNSSQIRAVAMALDERISLIQGPPGTGKSSTIVSIIQLLKVHFRHPSPILLVAPTHVAADLLLDLLIKARLNPLRTGRLHRVRSGLRQWTIDKRREEHPLWEETELARVTMEDRRVEKCLIEDKLVDETLGDRKRENLEEDLKLAKSMFNKASYRYKYLNNRLYSSLLATADVFVTTALGAGQSNTINYIDFPIVFIDEAAMCTEPVTLVPLMKGAQHITLIGDHKQLPAVMTSKQAKLERLHVSLFERLMTSEKVNTVLLSTQYRMRPIISEFPNRSFYDGKLANGATLFERGPPPKCQYFNTQSGETIPSPHVFINHENPDSYLNSSTVNKVEVKIIVKIVGDLLNRNPTLSAKDIAIITFYSAQTRLLRDTFDYDASYELESLLGRSRAETLSQVEVNTVDGFQGREKSVVILSTVRSNSGGYIGFLRDKRRLNVALTRAKDGLIVVGNKRTLRLSTESDTYLSERDPDQDSDIWRRYLSWIDENGLYRNWVG